VTHDEERFRGILLLNEIQRLVRDDIGSIAFLHTMCAIHADEDRIMIFSLTRDDGP
jgi:hypothetical protein